MYAGHYRLAMLMYIFIFSQFCIPNNGQIQMAHPQLFSHLDMPRCCVVLLSAPMVVDMPYESCHR